MNLSYKIANAWKKVKKTNLVSKTTLNQTPVHGLIKNKRAISAIVSNIILVGAVIIVGLAVLAWSQSQSSSYQRQYSGVVNANINQLQEKLVFEYVVVNGSNLNVYLLNVGSQNVTFASVLVNGQANATAVKLHPFGDSSTVLPSIGSNQQAYFSVPTSGISPYSIKIVTGRGSIFAGSS